MEDEFPIEGCPTPIQATQLSLAELFFVTTLSAVAIGIYLYVSPLLAFLGGGGLVVSAIVRYVGCNNVVVGGLVGFFAAATIVVMICLGGGARDVGTFVSLSLLCPAAGYLLGACVAELSNDGTF